LRNMIALADRTEDDWKPPIVTTVATRNEGIQELVSRLNQHWAWLSETGELKNRRLARAREELTALAFAALRGRLAGGRLDELAALLRPYGLTFARYEALVLLTFSRRGALPLGMIGERLMVHPTSVTNTISRLERQQLVIRRPNPSDGRGRLAEITDAGR